METLPVFESQFARGNESIDQKDIAIIAQRALQLRYEIFSELFQSYSTEIMKKKVKTELQESGHDANNISALVYGDIEFFSFLSIMQSAGVKQSDRFIDLGHGTGKAMICAHLMFGDRLESIFGIELLKILCDASIDVISNYQQLISNEEYSKYFSNHKNCTIEAKQGDFFDNALYEKIVDSDVVFINSTCFDDDMMVRLSNILQNLKPGSRIITLTKSLVLESGFEIKYKENFPMSWGIATCYIHVRK